jgi:hypothetical protein
MAKTKQNTKSGSAGLSALKDRTEALMEALKAFISECDSLTDGGKAPLPEGLHSLPVWAARNALGDMERLAAELGRNQNLGKGDN